MPVLEKNGSIMVQVTLKNKNMNTKGKKPYDSTLRAKFLKYIDTKLRHVIK